jgi:hypothetical protein
MDLAKELTTIAKSIDTLIDYLPGAHVSYEDQVSKSATDLAIYIVVCIEKKTVLIHSFKIGELKKLNEENMIAGKKLEMMLDLAKELLNDIQMAIYQLTEDRLKELSVPRL